MWNASSGTFRKRFRAILCRLIPDPSIFTPGSLRSGGATHLFQVSNEDVAKVMWRGRWKSMKMLEIYIPELTAASISLQFGMKNNQLMQKLAELFDSIVQ